MAFAFSGAGHDDDEVGPGDTADPDFASVDDPLAVILCGAGGHGGGVASGAGLGDGGGGVGNSLGVGFQVTLALSGVGDGEQHMEVGGVGGEGEGNDGAAEFLVNSHQGCGGEVGAAELLWDIEGPEAEFAAFFEQGALFVRGEGVRVAGGFAGEDGFFQGHEVAVHEFGDQVGKHAVFFGERHGGKGRGGGG